MRRFFILAMGRSGTHFLAHLLSSDARGVVHHEPHPGDRFLLSLRRGGRFDLVVEQLLEQRFAELTAQCGDVEFYGEVNSYLRHEAPWLRRRFDPVLIHLVRDGREFVRSAWQRTIYTEWETETPILPLDEDPHAARWGSMSRFERICWAWTDANETLAADVPDWIRFEDMLARFDRFAECVLEPTGVQLSETVWRARLARPSNTSRRYAWRARLNRLLPGSHPPAIAPLPRWRDWDSTMSRQFREICGDTMRRFGYDL